MTSDGQGRVLSVIVCGAGPASTIGTLIKQAQERDWMVQVIATPAALDFFDQAAIASQTGRPVRSQYRTFVNSALASRAPFRRSVEALRAEGIHILIDPGGIQPHPPHTGGDLIDSYPWYLALDEAERLVSARAGQG